MATIEHSIDQPAAKSETATQNVLVELLTAALQAQTTDTVVDGEPMMRRFEWAVDRLSQVNVEAAALVEDNTTSIALMQALGERIERSNRENSRLLDEIVNGAAV